MKIVGGRDFYDAGAMYGIDPDVVFVRQVGSRTRAIADSAFKGSGWEGHNISTMNPRFERLVSRRRGGWHEEAITAIVAGKRYGGMHVYPVADEMGFTDPPDAREAMFWDPEAYQAWRESAGLARIAPVRQPTGETTNPLDHFSYALTPQHVAWLVENRITVAVRAHHQEEWLIDADNLKSFLFFHRLDAVTCFQEIAMWVGGVLGAPDPKTVEITDDTVKRDKHGFDKRSFRKDKQSK